jgi:hypothetical protein
VRRTRGRGETAFELDHIQPRSRGGSDRVSNLALSCHACNVAKGDHTAAEFGHPEVAALAKQPLRDAAAVNATRFALCDELRKLGLPLTSLVWRTHQVEPGALLAPQDARAGCGCRVGELAGGTASRHTTLAIKATGRGRYSRTNVDEHGFPVGYLMRAARR